jgi:hypothetical protein
MFLVERLRSTAARSSASATAEAESDEGHEQSCDDCNDGYDYDEPVLLQKVVILMFLHVRSPGDFHVVGDNEIA